MAISEGDKAPGFTLKSDAGTEVSLADFKGRQVVIYFYPKDSTPGCTQQACDFRDALPELERKGVAVLGISRDSVASHQKFKAKQDLNFPLLSDPDTGVLQAYGAWGEKTLYGKKFLGCIRTTVLIGKDGHIAKLWPKVKVAGHADAVLAALG